VSPTKAGAAVRFSAAKGPTMKRGWKVALVMFLWGPLTTTTLLGCKDYEDLMKQVSESGLPVMTSVVPASAKAGEVITLRGSNFGTMAGRVGFDDANNVAIRAEIVSWNADFIVTKVPVLAGNPTNTKIRLMNYEGKETPLPFEFVILK
jgi:hypothetical protein